MSVFHRFRYLMQAGSLPEQAAESLADFFEEINVEHSRFHINFFEINGNEVHSAEEIRAVANHPFFADFDFEGDLNFRARMYIEEKFGVLQEDDGISLIIYEENDDFAYIRTYGDVDEENVELADMPDKEFFGSWPGVFFTIPTEKLSLECEQYEDVCCYDFTFGNVFDETLAQELTDQHFCEEDIETEESDEQGEVFAFTVGIYSTLTKSYLDTVNRLYRQMGDAIKKFDGVMEPHTSNGNNPFFTFADADDMIQVFLSVADDGVMSVEATKYSFSEKL